MKPDNLERFVMEHRSEFDHLTPNPQIWSRIDASINPGRPSYLIHWLVGIIIVLVAGISLLIGLQMGKSNQIEPVYFASQEEYNEFQETEMYYTTMVNYQLNNLGDSPEELKIKDDIIQLDEIYNELKTELINAPSSDKGMIIDLMIQNYKTKIEILERVRSRSAETKNYNDENIFDNETINL